MRWPLSVPVLSDGVVTLRAHVPGDLAELVEMAVDPDMERWTAIPVPYTLDMAEQFAFTAMPRGWDDGTHRGWAIEVVDDDGRHRFAGNLDVRQKPIADIGFALHPWAGSTVLESDRLRLRPFAERDVPRLVEACNDPLSRHFLAGLPTPYTTPVAVAYVNDCVWQAATGTKATWAIADRSSDELLGNIAVMDMLGVNSDHGEIGYWLHPEARGRGIMTEATRMVVDHALDADGLDRRRLVLYAAADNAASNAVAIAAGFTYYGTQRVAERLGDGSYDDLRGYELVR